MQTVLSQSPLWYSFTVFSFFLLAFDSLCVCVCVCVCSQVINGQLVFSVSRGSTRLVRLRLDQVQVSDGRWHDLQLELRDVRSGRETRYVATLRLDFGLYQVINRIQSLNGRFSGQTDCSSNFGWIDFIFSLEKYKILWMQLHSFPYSYFTKSKGFNFPWRYILWCLFLLCLYLMDSQP